MNKGTLIAIAIGALVVVGGGGYYLMNRSTSPAPSPQTGQTANTTSESSSANSLRGLLGLAQSQQCTFSDAESGSEGTVYASGENLRGDFTAVSDGQTFGSHLIITGDDVYIWMDGATDGFKSSLSDIEEANEQIEEYTGSDSESDAMDLDNQVDYSCRPWTVDNSMFNLPSGVNFEDFEAMMEEATGNIEEETEVNCEACDNLPAGEAQTECRQALGC